MCNLLSTAVDAHGGLSRWREISSLECRLRVRDVALEADAPARELSVIASTHLPLICLEDLQPDGRICSSTHEQIRLYGKSGELLTWRNREDMRTGCPSNDGLDVEDVFRSSSALWVTLNSPFLFTWPGFVTREIAGGHSDCGPVRRLLVGFPPGLGNATHIAVVSFDRDGLMRNLRYAAKPSPIPSPVLYARDHEAHDGIIVGGHQYVQTALPRRDGTLDRLLLSMDIDDVRFR